METSLAQHNEQQRDALLDYLGDLLLHLKLLLPQPPASTGV